jgi:transcriptional regulator with XRE-family HTH domain
VPAKEVDDLIDRMAAWCSREHGRQQEIAEAIGVSKQHVSNLLARRRTPTLAQFLAIRDFLDARAATMLHDRRMSPPASLRRARNAASPFEPAALR